MADNMTAGKMMIDPAPIISKLADRARLAKDPECSLLCEVIEMLMAAPTVTIRFTDVERKKLYAVLTKERNPAWRFLPSNREILELANYLLINRVTVIDWGKQ